MTLHVSHQLGRAAACWYSTNTRAPPRLLPPPPSLCQPHSAAPFSAPPPPNTHIHTIYYLSTHTPPLIHTCARLTRSGSLSSTSTGSRLLKYLGTSTGTRACAQAGGEASRHAKCVNLRAGLAQARTCRQAGRQNGGGGQHCSPTGCLPNWCAGSVGAPCLHMAEQW